MTASLPYNNHARSRLGLGNGSCRKCPQGEVGSPCWVLYGKPTPKQHIREHTPFESHWNESTAVLIRKITIQELARTSPIRQLFAPISAEGGIRLLPKQYYITIKYTIIYY